MKKTDKIIEVLAGKSAPTEQDDESVEQVIYRDGKLLIDRPPAELALINYEHRERTHPSYNPDDATAEASTEPAKMFLERAVSESAAQTDAGRARGEHRRREREAKEAQIAAEEKTLRASGETTGFNKRIARNLNLRVDYVRKVRATEKKRRRAT